VVRAERGAAVRNPRLEGTRSVRYPFRLIRSNHLRTIVSYQPVSWQLVGWTG
jgi:hypothetical protein